MKSLHKEIKPYCNPFDLIARYDIYKTRGYIFRQTKMKTLILTNMVYLIHDTLDNRG